MENRIKLTTDHINKLSDLPEQGMGYQIVDLELLNGRLLCKKTVLNSTYLILPEGEKVDPLDIIRIDIHHEESK